MLVLAPIAAMLLQLAVSRQREYLADATGAQLLGRAAPLADALETLERGTEALPMEERIRRLRALDGAPVVPATAAI